MKILLTGGKGFLGNTIAEYFKCNAGYEIKVLSRDINSDYSVDLATTTFYLREQFDVVIHAAGKAHSIPKTGIEAQKFFDVNFNGTVNLLTSLEASLPKTFVFMSSVSVYGISEGKDISESHVLSAEDPYGKSKALAEQEILKWCSHNRVKCVIFRLPLLVGLGAPGNLKSMIKGIKKGYYFNIDGGRARRSMLLVNDVPRAIEAVLDTSGIFNLTDGAHPSYKELSNAIALQLGKRKIYNMPYQVAFFLAKFGDFFGAKFPINSCKFRKLTESLTFDDEKIRKKLKWQSSSVLENIRI
ncbi:Nucleoside-diphosphate-sugar epimerase [Hydrobacter penzbergensis]|uniref:Nucleoside-diphosphate-sugar epimerase n=1 Tax=Hydrobacter penzbergensis TaxID=1235997 RepID=A0A8X8IFB8_9BACT|nr:NAD-dependent epimerase/dehydratase family protein [Hydrobacter penzbergensis]SDW85239.1 Nucleoside-diphosphate-sugar epimerase [Hydrobacter penzbergensis]